MSANIRTILLLAVALLASPATAGERSFMTGSFDIVVVEGDVEVRVVDGPYAVIGEGEARDLDRLSVKRNGRTLKIGMESVVSGSATTYRPAGPVLVTVRARDLHSARMTGNGSLSLDRLKGWQTDLTLVGSGALSVGTVDSEKLRLTLIGNGSVSVDGGKVDDIVANVDGTGSVDADGLRSDELQLRQTGPASSQWLIDRSANITQQGSGTIDVKGSATCLLSTTGSGKVLCERFGK